MVSEDITPKEDLGGKSESSLLEQFRRSNKSCGRIGRTVENVRLRRDLQRMIERAFCTSPTSIA